MKADKNNSIGRYKILLALTAVAGLYIFGKAVRTMLPPYSDYFEEVSKRYVKENKSKEGTRGNILDCNGNILSSSIPEYQLRIDFRVVDPDSASKARTERFRDSVFNHCLDSIANGLADIFPDYDSKWFRQRLLQGKKSKRFSWRIYPKNATYIEYTQCKKLPLLREGKLKGGFHGDIIPQRVKPYGRLAARTIGDMAKDTDTARSGLEQSFDTILRGKPGVGHVSFVRNVRVEFEDQAPIDGHDLMTTLDINLQDFADRTLRNKLREPEVNGDVGIAVVMEVKTGDVKALVNLKKCSDGEYYDIKNHALSDLYEPGSTFKTGSIMVALEDGYITKDTRVNTGNGDTLMYGRHMKDHNWRTGGCHTITVTEVLGKSSNIGVSMLIDKVYHKDPDRYVTGLNRLGIGIPLHLPFKGTAEPYVKHPKKEGRHYSNWSNTSLPWMSIGYECALPPISTLTFYNAIANNGKMVKPRFVKYEMKDGEILREFPVEVIKESICKPSTLADIQEILEKVVSKGLGKRAGNGGKYFKVSGKTGTAQVSAEDGSGYGIVKNYFVSFCGYFPSEAPQYSCFVGIKKRGTPASGGTQCGPVFKEISEYLMSQNNYLDPSEASDSNSVFTPAVSVGNSSKSSSVLKTLGIKGKVKTGKELIAPDKVPDVTGMGARDAVYEIQKRGMKVRIHGRGKVKGQDMPPGTMVQKGKTITLTLGKEEL